MTRAGEGARRRARELVFRAVFQSDLLGDAVADTWRTARDSADPLAPDPLELAEDLVRILNAHRDEIDAAIQVAAEHWEMDRLAATDRAVLRCAVAELLGRRGTPARVVLDEAIGIAKRFGSDASGSFVNGVLDRVARRLRAEEFA
jgi:N utilization substance protein B